MKIALRDKNNWTMQGVRILLEQLGIPFELARSFLESDVFITNEDASIPGDKAGIIIGSPSSDTKESRGSFLIYKDAKAYYPESVAIPLHSDSSEVIASFEDEEPAIIQQENKIYILPNFFEYIAKATTLRVYNKTFAETFSWDEFRQIFLYVLELVSDYLGKSLIRIWYYPSMDYNNSVTYTTDIDHRLSWEIIKNLNSRQAKLISVASRFVPYYFSVVLGIAASHRFFGKGRFDRKYMDTKSAFVGRVFKRLHLSLPVSFYPASIYQLQKEKLPISAFLRSGEYQEEEKESVYPFRQRYKPKNFDNDCIEVGLHFGATIGEADNGFIEDPYGDDPFREGILRQIEGLQNEIETSKFGTRLHHIYKFNQEIFYYLNQAAGISVLYDSSIFGTISKVNTFHCPAGVSLPYYPILLSDKNLSGDLIKSSFVELPVAAYETSDIPFEKLIKNKSAIIISEHPDKTKSKIVKNLLNGYTEYGKTWWKVTLGELASWWNVRHTIKVGLKDNVISLNGIIPSELNLCLVIYPAKEEVKLPENCHVLRRNEEGNSTYLDLIAS